MKNKIIGILVCMLLIFTVIPVAETLNQNNSNDNQLENKDNFFSSKTNEDWWAMFRHDSANTGSSTCIAPDNNVLCWQQTVSDIVELTSPIVVENKLYISTIGYYEIEPPEQLDLQIQSIHEKSTLLSNIPKIKSEINEEYDATLYCIDAVNGTLLWDFYIGFWGHDPAVIDGKVYVTLGDFYNYNSIVYCLDAETGNIIWQNMTSEWIISPVIVADDKIYVGSLDYYGYSGKLYCLNAQNGDTIWTYTIPPFEFMYFSSAAVADGLVYFVTSSSYYYYYDYGNLYCLNASTGEYQWDQPVGYSELCSPVVADGRVYINNFDLYNFSGTIYCFDADTGSPLWTYDLGFYQFAFSNPAFYNGSIYVAVTDYSSYNGGIYCVDAETGDPIWNIQTSGCPYYSSPSIADNKLYIPVGDFYGSNGELLCLDIDDGDLIWDYTLDYMSMSSAAIATGRVYIPDYFGNIYAIGCPNEPPDPPSNPDPADKATDVSIDADLSWDCSDPDGDEIVYDIYFEADDATPDILVADDQTATTFDPGTLEYGTTYYWQIIAIDEHDAATFGPIWQFTTEENMPPDAPSISGQKEGKIKTEYEYIFKATDANGDDVRYNISWGDGDQEWTDYYTQDTDVKVNHTFEDKGTFYVKAYAQDEHGADGPETEYEVTMPKNKPFVFNFPLLNWLFERFPNMFSILRLIFQRLDL